MPVILTSVPFRVTHLDALNNPFTIMAYQHTCSEGEEAYDCYAYDIAGNDKYKKALGLECAAWLTACQNYADVMTSRSEADTVPFVCKINLYLDSENPIEDTLSKTLTTKQLEHWTYEPVGKSHRWSVSFYRYHDIEFEIEMVLDAFFETIRA